MCVNAKRFVVYIKRPVLSSFLSFTWSRNMKKDSVSCIICERKLFNYLRIRVYELEATEPVQIERKLFNYDF